MRSAQLTGAVWAVVGVTCFSANDVMVKLLSDVYPLYQVIFLRSLVALAVVAGVLLPLSTDTDTLRTERLAMHLLRGLCIVVANFCFFLSLAAMPLADAVAIFFVAPLIIAVLSVVLLGESVGPRRWAAIAVGFVGVLIVLRPGTAAFQVAALLPLGAASAYALLHIMTRRIGQTETAIRLAFYIHVVFVAVGGVAGILLGHGGFDVFDHPSAEFLLRAWTVPSAVDLTLIGASGVASAMGGFAVSSAYRHAEAAVVAPFEYVALPLAVIWGLAVFGDLPDAVALAGIALILTSGLVLIWREARAHRQEEVSSLATPPGGRH